MTKAFKKCYKIFLLAILALVIHLNFAIICYGQAPLDKEAIDKMSLQEEAFRQSSGFEGATETSIATVVALVIQAFLALLGIIFVVLIVIAGNKWMNARGNEEKVEEAQDTIRRAIIGLVITVSAYAITYFVFSNLPG